jgi:hypothetical protein
MRHVHGTGDIEESEPKPKRRKLSEKWCRTKAFRWTVEVDNALKGATGDLPGLKLFQLPEGWRSNEELLKRALSWPCLAISSDEGSDGWTAMNWMDSDLGRVNFIREPDVENHGKHNDWLGSTREAGLGSFMYSLVVCLNLMFLPWNDGRFGGAIMAGAKYLQEGRQLLGSPLWAQFEQWIATEKDLASGTGGQKYDPNSVWEAFCNTSRFLALPKDQQSKTFQSVEFVCDPSHGSAIAYQHPRRVTITAANVVRLCAKSTSR